MNKFFAQAVSVTFAALQITILALVAAQHTVGWRALLAGVFLDLVVALVIIVLVDLEHLQSLRPSFLVSAYLIVTLLLDLARVRTSWLVPESWAYPAFLSASLAVKLLLLMLNNIEKRKLLVSSERDNLDSRPDGHFQSCCIWSHEPSLLLKGN